MLPGTSSKNFDTISSVYQITRSRYSLPLNRVLVVSKNCIVGNWWRMLGIRVPGGIGTVQSDRLICENGFVWFSSRSHRPHSESIFSRCFFAHRSEIEGPISRQGVYVPCTRFKEVKFPLSITCLRQVWSRAVINPQENGRWLDATTSVIDPFHSPHWYSRYINSSINAR